ncbi:MAG TPA: HD domain-containing phosphohydrolase [Polyangia bacterium]|jgi:HD-GYP domain|nr:HD domain-containing phosphohydrolase [Polyangia bacterium]
MTPDVGPSVDDSAEDTGSSSQQRFGFTLSTESPRILVVDDERVIREMLSDFLGLEGYVVRTVEDGVQALEELQRRSYNLVISDLKMPNMNGLELIEKITELGIPVLTVIMTGFGTVETAIEAMKHGAYDYVLKPFRVEEVVHTVQRGLDRQRLQHENLRLKDALSIYKISEAIATSLSLERVLDLVLDSVLDAVNADVANLLLERPQPERRPEDPSGPFVEYARKVSPRFGPSDRAPPLNFAEVLPLFQEDKPLLAHGARAHRFLLGPPEKRLVSFCSIPLKLKGRIIGMLSAYSYSKGAKFSEGQRKMLYVLGSRAAVSIENARLYESLVDTNKDLSLANVSLEENFRQTIIGFAHALEESDRYTRGHSERVSTYARLIAVGMRMPEAQIETIVKVGLLHDVGKIGIRNDRLNKPGKLTPEELAMFRSHPAKGKRILEPIPFMRDIVPGCYCHHEAWDGSGYPQGLRADAIPLIGRIVAVADAYDAMTTDRAYRQALPHVIACGELERCSGTQFDPEIVRVFLMHIEEHRKLELLASHIVPR